MELEITEALILAMGSLGIGMFLLIRGGEWTIDSAVYVARHAGVSPLIIGFTIIAFGTSLPELLVSVNANMHGSPGIAVGNVLGSNIANILLVIGATAVFCTIKATPREIMHDITIMLATTAALAALLLHGEISRIAGASMVLFLLGYVLWEYLSEKKHHEKKDNASAEEEHAPHFDHLGIGIAYLIVGMLCIALGAEFLVRGAKVSATIIGVPEAVIGLSIIALGTSLPELTTCIIAAKRKQSQLILGNILGSNVFNVLMIIGITTWIKPINVADIAPQLVNQDIWLTMAISVIFALILLLYKKVTRPIGLLFLVAYVTYIISIFVQYFT
jgi:cation:H+ antiporter